MNPPNSHISAVAVGIFADRHSADLALDVLHAASFSDDQLGIAALDRDRIGGDVEAADDTASARAAQGAGAGAVAGASAGAIWALGIVSGMLPAVGPVLAGGLLAAFAASAAGGAAAGGIIGTLMAVGIPEDEAQHYQDEIKAGRTVVTVRAGDRFDEATVILNDHGGFDVHGPTDRAPT